MLLSGRLVPLGLKTTVAASSPRLHRIFSDSKVPEYHHPSLQNCYEMEWKFLEREAKSETVRNAGFNTLTLNNQDKPHPSNGESLPHPQLAQALQEKQTKLCQL